MERIKALTDTAVLQIEAYPSLTSKEKVKRLIKSCIPGKRLAPLDAFSWPNALLGKGLLCAWEAVGDESALRAVAGYLKRWKAKGFPIRYVDNLMNGTLAMELEGLLRGGADSGTASASSSGTLGGAVRASVSGTSNATASVSASGTSSATASVSASGIFGAAEVSEYLALCREAADACAAWLKAAPRTENGLLPYRKQHPDWLFADALAMVSPFACRYGKERGDEELSELGARQLTDFLEKGMDVKSGLPYHGYDEKNGMKYGIIGWGRACGWMLLGLAESLAYVESEGAFAALEKAYGELLTQVFKWQREDGGFSWQLSAQEGHADSSAEGMIGLAYALAKKNLQKAAFDSESICTFEAEMRVNENIARLYEISKKRVIDGKVGSCSGECLGFAEYPQVYGSYSWGNGSILGFLSLWSKEWEE